MLYCYKSPTQAVSHWWTEGVRFSALYRRGTERGGVVRAVQERERDLEKDREVGGERERGGEGERETVPRFGKPVTSDVPSQRGEQSLLGKQPGGR